jgi:tetratricopeptide (TPR) repeat protein
LEHDSRNLTEAVRWGWKAVGVYPSREERVTALATLGATLIDLGDLGAAADAWACTRDLATNDYYRLYALDALGHICALRGDHLGFARWAGEADGLGWESGPLSAKAEILHYRGLSHLALGDAARAREYLERAVSFAEEHHFGQTLFAAESALRELNERAKRSVASGAQPTAPVEVSAGLRQMRRGLEVATPA